MASKMIKAAKAGKAYALAKLVPPGDSDAAKKAERVLRAARSSSGWTVLHHACFNRAGGAGEAGWLGCLRLILSRVGDDKEFLNARNSDQRSTALWLAADGAKPDAASEAQQFVAVAVLLLYGASPLIVDDVRQPRAC